MGLLIAFESMTGYKTFTTFWMDFSIADRFGVNAVKDTFKRAFNDWKTDYKYLTELSLILNWKSWQYSTSNTRLASVYDDAYYEVRTWALNNLKGEELDYYIITTD